MKKLLLILFAFSFLLSPAPNPKNNRRVVNSAYKYDNSAQTYFNTFQGTANFVTDPYRRAYDQTIKFLKQRGEWSNLECFFWDATGNKVWALTDIRTPTRTASKVNTYAGEFTVNSGWNGNASFSLLTNFNPTGSTVSSQNNCSFGVLRLLEVASSTRHEVSAFNAGFTQGTFLNAQVAPVTVINSALSPTTSYTKFKFTTYCWLGNNRTASNVNTVYVNGVKSDVQTPASVAINNISIGRMNAYNGAWAAAATFGSNNQQGAFYYGNGSVNQNNIIAACNTFLTSATITSTRAKIQYRVTFEGDSMTGSVGFPALSATSLYPSTTISTLGSGWSGSVVSEANETVQSMVTQAATEITPYRNTLLAKDIVVIFAGTNDLATNRTAAQLYSDMTTWAAARKAEGFKVIIVGVCDRDAGFSGGQTQGGFDAARASYRSLMNADFAQSTAISNVFSSTTVSYADYWIDISADSKFNNAADGTYFQGDLIHLNSTAYPIVANTYVAPTIQLF